MRKDLLIILLLIVTTCVTFAPVYDHDFVNFDDSLYVTGNSRVQSGLSWENVKWAFQTRITSNWYPLTWISLMFNAETSGLEARGFHVTNLLLHVMNTLVLYGVLRQMTGSFARSAFVAALFALHPLHVESVVWVSGRKDLLSGLFGLLAMGAYARYARHQIRWAYAATIVLFLFSLMSKQMLVTFPFLLLLLDYWPLERTQLGWRRLVAEKIPFLAISLLFSLLSLQTQNRQMGLMETLPISWRCLNAIVVYMLYLEKTFWPSHLAIFYPHPGQSLAMSSVVVAAVLLVTTSTLAFVCARRRPSLFVGWFWYLGTLVPVIGLVQIGGQQMADRYTYLPLIGIFVAAAWLVPTSGSESKWQWILVGGLAVSLLFCCAVLTRKQTTYWRNSITLFQHALAVTERNALAHNNLGTAINDDNQPHAALVQLRKSLEIDPDYLMARFNLGVILAQIGQLDEAKSQYEMVLQADPSSVTAHVNLATVLGQLGQLPEAVHHCRAALEHEPHNTTAHYNLAVALNNLGRADEAAHHFQQARQFSERPPVIRSPGGPAWRTPSP